MPTRRGIDQDGSHTNDHRRLVHHNIHHPARNLDGEEILFHLVHETMLGKVKAREEGGECVQRISFVGVGRFRH